MRTLLTSPNAVLPARTAPPNLPNHDAGGTRP